MPRSVLKRRLGYRTRAVTKRLNRVIHGLQPRDIERHLYDPAPVFPIQVV